MTTPYVYKSVISLTPDITFQEIKTHIFSDWLWKKREDLWSTILALSLDEAISRSNLIISHSKVYKFKTW